MDYFEILILSTAHSDIAEHVGFVLNVSKEAAIKLKDNLYSSIESLTTFPERNPIFEMPKTFPFTIRKQVVNQRYIVLYYIENDRVIVVRVLDTRRGFTVLL